APLIREAISEAMPTIRSIIIDELKEDPALLLGADTWQTLLQEASVFKEEQIACRATFDSVEWGSDVLFESLPEFSCTECTSTLVKNVKSNAKSPDELELVCSQCGVHLDTDD